MLELKFVKQSEIGYVYIFNRRREREKVDIQKCLDVDDAH